MPRTKRVTKKVTVPLSLNDTTSSISENDPNQLILDDFNQQWDMEMSKVMKAKKEIILKIERIFAIAMLNIPPAIANKPIEILDREDSKLLSAGLETEVPSSATSFDTCNGSPNVSDVSVEEASTNRILRSSRGGSRNMMGPPSMMDRFRTPNCNLVPDGSRYNMITPKVAPNCPMSILRRPREGEIAFAMSGSPLMVSNMGTEQTANVIVPLGDGRVMSILPQVGLRAQDMPEVDNNTMRQLLKLRDNLNKMIAKDYKSVKQ